MTVTPWIREIDITLGPLEEWRGKERGEVIGIKSDGSMAGLRVSCQVQKTLMGAPNASTITVYNLANDTRDSIRSRLTKVVVEVGYANTEKHILFQGSVVSVVHERSGADIVTKISALPGYGAMVRGIVSKTYASKASVRSSVVDLAKQLPGVTIDDKKIVGISGQMDSGGWSFAGSAKDALTRLAEERGFSWSIVDGVFHAIGDDDTLTGGIVLLNGDKGPLISVTPSLEGPQQIQNGVKIKAIYVPGIVPGHIVEVESTVSPKLNGQYKVNTINVNVDTFSSTWTMDIDTVKTRSLL